MRSEKNKYGQLIFSCLSGYNYYKINDRVPSKNIPNISAVHMQNGAEVEIHPRDLLTKEACLEKWRGFIEYPADIRSIIWPIDIVFLDENEEHFGFVYRKRAFPKLELLKKILYNDTLLDWRNENIQHLIVNFLNVCDSLHFYGYAYHGFDLAHMYYNPDDMSVLLDFSLSLSKTYGQLHRTETIAENDVAIEMLPPWHQPFKPNDMDLSDDYYSITALLFRLMIGRMPYQGRLMDGAGDMMNSLRDTDELNHLKMFEQYLSQPVFIFDPYNSINSIGLVTSEEKYIARWDALPEKVRDMFLNTLCQKNVERSPNDRKCYSPEDWLKILSHECFDAK